MLFYSKYYNKLPEETDVKKTSIEISRSPVTLDPKSLDEQQESFLNHLGFKENIYGI